MVTYALPIPRSTFFFDSLSIAMPRPIKKPKNIEPTTYIKVTDKYGRTLIIKSIKMSHLKGLILSLHYHLFSAFDIPQNATKANYYSESY